jgi:hypothetical protein
MYVQLDVLPTADADFNVAFPKLGEIDIPIAVAKPILVADSYSEPKQNRDNVAPKESTRQTPYIPVCRFAVMGKMRCKNAREGKRCQYRHPEIAADNVTQEEILQAKEEALRSMNKTKSLKQDKGNSTSSTINCSSNKNCKASTAKTFSMCGSNEVAKNKNTVNKSYSSNSGIICFDTDYEEPKFKVHESFKIKSNLNIFLYKHTDH